MRSESLHSVNLRQASYPPVTVSVLHLSRIPHYTVQTAAGAPSEVPNQYIRTLHLALGLEASALSKGWGRLGEMYMSHRKRHRPLLHRGPCPARRPRPCSTYLPADWELGRRPPFPPLTTTSWATSHFTTLPSPSAPLCIDFSLPPERYESTHDLAMFTQKFLVALLLAASLVSASVLRFGLDKRIKKRAPGDVITKCTVNNTVALTFDDGPYIWLNEIVDTLNAANAKGTFFFNGDNFGCIYDEAMTARVKYAYDHGHQMASHTWRHLHLNTLNEHQLHVEMWAVEEAIYRITGVYVAFTRPPFGEYNALVQQVAAARGQTLANWDFDSRDAAGASMAQTLGAYTSLIGSRPPTILTLNHEVNPDTPRDLPNIIRELQAAGYQLVTLAECLGQEPYQFVSPPQVRDASWTCGRR